jgi:hypothetical protein
VLGIGKRQKIDWLQIQWPLPSGKIERFTDLPIDRYVTIVEGEGICRKTPEHPCSAGTAKNSSQHSTIR